MQITGTNGSHKIRHGLTTAAFLLVMALFLPITHAGGLGFAPLAATAGIAGYLGYVGKARLSNIPIEVIALAVFLIWALITSRWSAYEDTQSVINPVKLLLGVGLYLGVFLLPPKPWLGRLLVIISVVLLILMLGDLLTKYSISKIFYPLGADEHPIARDNSIYQNLGHSLTVLALMAPLVLYHIARKSKAGRYWAGLWVVVCLFCAAKAGLTIGLLALLAALFFMGLSFYLKSRGLDLLILLSMISILFAPLAGYFMNFVPQETKDRISDSWEHRVEMWGYVAEKIAEKPFLGHGFDAARTFDRTYKGMSVNGTPWEQTIVSLHPHNAGLHIWSETGAVGAALACLTLFLLRQRLSYVIKQRPERLLPIVGFLAAALMICTFTYGIWQEWFWGVLILIAALIPMSIMTAD